VARLQAEGLSVTIGVCAEEALEINAGFFLTVAEGRPLVTLKAAVSLDGRIATRTGHSQWMTGPAARRASHLLRASHDAILIGSGTALADDPSLSCRLPGMQSRSPVRIVVDGRLRLATRRLNLVATAREIPTWIVTTSDADRELRSMLTGMGATVIGVEKDGSGHPQARAIVAALAERGVTRVLVEGGTAVAGSFLAAGLIDRMAVFRAPKMIGADGLAMAGELGVSSLESAPTYVRCGVGEIASDLVEFYKSA
jgi:diaminohydroxyphosphoribosylaminopyrimidine deaminase/5-amino-6-(5-phosphoribosylamino)uracil reductase